MALKDLTGFVRRFSATEGMTDATYGFPYGSTNVATAFSAPGRGGGGTDGWATRSGASGGASALFLPNTIGGPQPAYVGGPGLAFQFDATGACPDSYFADGTAANQVPMDGGTVLMCVRCPLGLASVTDMTNPATLNTSAQFWFSSLLYTFTNKWAGAYTTWNRALVGSLNGSATVANTGPQLSGGREVIAFRLNTGANLGMTIDMIRSGALVGSNTAGTADAGIKANYHYIGSMMGAGNRAPFVLEDISFFKARLSDADLLTAAAEVRSTYESTTYAPTTMLDIIGDSITCGYLTVNCANYVAHLQARLPNLYINPMGVAGADAQTWDSTTLFDGSIVIPGGTAPSGYSNCIKRVGLIFLGANAIGAGQSANTWIGYMNNVADRYFALTGRKPYAVVPICRGHGADPAANEALRRQYRTALLSSTHFAGIIDTDTLEPTLVPQSASAYDTGYCAGGVNFQLPTSTSGAHALPGTLSYNSRAIGIDGLHPGLVGHRAIADMLLRDTTSGFAQEVGAVNPNLIVGGRTNRIGRD